MACKKIRYDSKQEAAKRNPGRYGKPYPCKECGSYHVGHKPNRKSIAEFYIKRFKTRIERNFAPLFEYIETICGV